MFFTDSLVWYLEETKLDTESHKESTVLMLLCIFYLLMTLGLFHEVFNGGSVHKQVCFSLTG